MRPLHLLRVHARATSAPRSPSIPRPVPAPQARPEPHLQSPRHWFAPAALRPHHPHPPRPAIRPCAGAGTDSLRASPGSARDMNRRQAPWSRRWPLPRPGRLSPPLSPASDLKPPSSGRSPRSGSCNRPRDTERCRAPMLDIACSTWCNAGWPRDTPAPPPSNRCDPVPGRPAPAQHKHPMPPAKAARRLPPPMPRTSPIATTRRPAPTSTGSSGFDY